MANTIAVRGCNRAGASNPLQISQPSIPNLDYPKLSKLAKPISLVCDFVEAAIALASPKGPSPYLQGNCAPVPEFGPQSNLPISGTLPPCLNGVFIRTGPNPKFQPVAGYHWFDGDGMLHGLRIKDGNATYISRYVKTARLLQEEHYGGAKFVKLGDMNGFLGVLFGMMFDLRLQLGVLDASHGTGTANTNLVYHNRKLMALHEGDKPYVIQMFEDGKLETMGRQDYDKKLTHQFTAHPKVDPITGEMFFFCHQFDSPFLIYRVVSKEGVIQSPVPITLSEAVFMHDFAITENYAIFMDLPCTMGPKNLIQGKFLFSTDSTRNARFGILPRYAVDEHAIRWFELPSCYIFHTANAWEEGDEVVLYACRANEMYLNLDLNIHQKDELYEFRFNLKNGAASQKQLSQGIVDFPRINENYIGRKQRYVYTCIFDSPLKSKGLVKFDLEKDLSGNDNVENIYLYGPGRYGGEAIFIPRTNAKDIDEDDGYLITFVYDETVCKSKVVVIDAKTMNSTPVAVVSLPVRVPYGFHAIFVNEEQLMESKID